jgi:hypothetical protein
MALITARKELDVSAGSALSSPNAFSKREHANVLPAKRHSHRTYVTLDEIASTTARAFYGGLTRFGFFAHAGIVAGRRFAITLSLHVSWRLIDSLLSRCS